MKHNGSVTAMQSWLNSLQRPLLTAVIGGMGTAAFVLLAGCGPVKLIANTNIPPPLVVKIPMGVALFVPQEFSGYVHKEERWSTDWHVELGKAQTESVTRLFNAMFERVVPVESVNAGTQVAGGVAAILEPSIEEYAFVTPRDAGSPFYAVSIKYRVNVYLPDGKLADSWGFTGYGTSPALGLSSQTPLSTATALAMRDAGAKLAVEFREQAVLRGLLPESESADAPPTLATPAGPGEAPTTTPTTTEAATGDAPATESPTSDAPTSDTPSGEAPTSGAAPGEAVKPAAPAAPPQEAATPAPEAAKEDAAKEPDPKKEAGGATAPAVQDSAADEPVEAEQEPAKPPAPETLALSSPFS